MFFSNIHQKHTLRQLKAIYSHRVHLPVVFSDGDKVLSESIRLQKLNHFGDDLIVVWARRSDPPLPSVPGDQVRSPLQGSATQPSEPSSQTLFESSRSPAKRRTKSPTSPEPIKRRRGTCLDEDLRSDPEQEDGRVAPAQSLTQNGSRPQDDPDGNIAPTPALATDTGPALQSPHPLLSVSASRTSLSKLPPRSRSSAPPSRGRLSLYTPPQTPLGDTRREKSMPLLGSGPVEESKPIFRSRSSFSSDISGVENKPRNILSATSDPRTSMKQVFI